MPSKDKFDKLIEIFKSTSEEATKKCASESEKLRALMVDSNHVFSSLLMAEKFRISLMDIRIFELQRLIVHILYLSLCGLNRNAFNNIRYFFESAIQSLYIDSRHSSSSLRTKIEILKEVEDKHEYRATSLIDKLGKIDYKKPLKKEYGRLSKIIHPSHRSIVEILDFNLFASKQTSSEYITTVNCKEISNVFESMEIVVDMVLFLYITCVPDKRKKILKSNFDIIKFSKKYNLVLLSKILKDRL